MSRASEAERVSLHDVELRTGSRCAGASSTVLEWIFHIVNRRHHDGVESGKAAAADRRKVNVVLYVSTEHVRGEVLRRIISAAGRQVHPVVSIEGDGVVSYACFRPVRRMDVESGGLSVDNSLDAREFFVGRIDGAGEECKCSDEGILIHILS